MIWSNEECSKTIVPEAMKRNNLGDFQFDFSNDPKVLEARKRILNSRDNILTRTEFPKCSLIASSNGDIQSGTKIKVSKKSAKDASMAKFNLDFKTASGRPVVKAVLPVASNLKVDNENERNRDRERCLGGRRIGAVAGQFFAPKVAVKNDSNDCLQNESNVDDEQTNSQIQKREGWKANELLKHFDNNIIDLIEAEILSKCSGTEWNDVAGLVSTKKALKEIIILPFLRPDIFTGIRAPPKGVLLFGPPGTGKTMIGRCVAAQCKATFFNISASSITSKWVGEGEKLVRALFTVARILQPSVIFIDEIDSLLTTRSEKEHESSRRIKTEFLIHLDGVATTTDERMLILGATNRPQELDDAVKRRFAKRLYIGLPCEAARAQIINLLICDQKHKLSDEDIAEVASLTEGYSGADVKQLCAEAAMEPVRSIVDSSSMDIASVDLEDIRSIERDDFVNAMCVVRPTVAENDLIGYREWNNQFGSLVKND